MNLLYLILTIPVLGILLMIFIGGKRLSGTSNIILTLANFILSLFLANQFLHSGVTTSQQFHIDAINLLLIIVTTFIATTTAIFSSDYMWHKVTTGKITKPRLHLYHIMYQVFLLMVLLALSTNNIGILWVAMEGATLASVLLVSLYRTPEAIEAAWKYFILCVVGIALALFGTILIYAAAAQLKTNGDAILWSVLYQHANLLNGPLLKLAFVFLLVGYGTKMGLVPLHNWLPDAYSESPAPVSTLLSGLLLNVALYALLRFKILADLALGAHLSHNLMIGFGVISFLIAAILLYRQNNIKRMFSYSSIEHLGLMTLAFGLGSYLATFSALFYMLIHALTKSAIFITIGNVVRCYGTKSMEKIRGLINHAPTVGWGLLIATFAIVGFPPFGIFLSEISLVVASVKVMPYLTIVIAIGLIVALSGLLHNLNPVIYGENSEKNTDKYMLFRMLPAFSHFILILALGIYIPPNLAELLNQATKLMMMQS